MEQITIGNTKLSLVQGDITRETSDAIVNAANSQLVVGGGVDGAINRAGGPAINAEARKYGFCPTGQAVITTAGKLAAKRVIHTVGPIYRGTAEDARLLASCHAESLRLAAAHGLRTISFPGISTGVYGYPLDEAAPVALAAVKESIVRLPEAFDEVRFVLFGGEALAAFARALRALPA